MQITSYEPQTVKVQENIPLAPLTTLQVGGAARYFAELKHEDDLSEALDFAKTRSLPLFVLGGGSNLVIADSGWPGLVLKIAIGGITTPKLQESAGNAVLFSVGAGVNWDDFVAHAISQNCAGIECLSGIPGSVGATPVQNVGAYGQEVADTIESVRAFDLKTPELKENRIVILPKPACGFRYRSSIFNSSERGRYIILRVNYRLKRGGMPSLKYADLQKYFADLFPGRKRPPSLAEVRDAVRAIRESKGMLIVTGDDEFPDNMSPDNESPDNDSRSAGSFFKNPVLSEAELEDLGARAASKALKIPSYPALDARHKVSAAWLVEHSGFSKGYALGNAGISHKHALAIINRGSAKASDIVALKDEIQKRVQQAWGVLLEPEPVFVGF
jgi:UDP-N-acetylmuramate dehydrogenase